MPIGTATVVSRMDLENRQDPVLHFSGLNASVCIDAPNAAFLPSVRPRMVTVAGTDCPLASVLIVQRETSEPLLSAFNGGEKLIVKSFLSPTRANDRAGAKRAKRR